MLPRHMSEEEHEHFGSVYPDPPQSTFSAPGIDMSLASEQYFPRFGQEFPAIMSGFDHIPYATEGPNGWTYGGRMSPHMFQEDREIGIPSNNSPASAPSAPSSAIGSPRSAHGQPAPISEWAGPQGVAMSPGIVGSHEYYTGTEYSFAPQGMEDLAPFVFADTSKPPGFVGELPQTPKQHLQYESTGSMSSPMSREFSCTSLAATGPLVDSQSAAAHAQTMRSPSSPETFRYSSVVASPTSITLLPSPAEPVRRTSSQVVSPFFSQSSGHFVAPLGSSCWFPYPTLNSFQGAYADIQLMSRSQLDPPRDQPASYDTIRQWHPANIISIS